MSTKKALPGLGTVGLQYNVKQYYADSRSAYALSPIFLFNLSGYDPDSDLDAVKINIFGNDYYFPKYCNVVPILRSTLTTQNTRSATDFELDVNIESSVKGWYALFGASLSSNFDASYLRSSSFYSIVQMGMISAYYLDLPSIEELKNDWMTPQAKDDINSTMDADVLVQRYGAFFLKSGVFGGSLNYSQSISRFAVQSEAAAAATVSANYSKFINASLSASTTVDVNSNSMQSNGILEAKGGDPTALNKGYSEWASTLQNQGSYVLVDFEVPSLQPLSVLADNPSRQQDINDAILRSLTGTPPDIYTLKVDRGKNQCFYAKGDSGDEIERTIYTNSDWQIIVGVACAVENHDVSRLAIRTLDLQYGKMSWITSDGRPFNASDYEVVNDLPSKGIFGVAVVGMGFTAHSSNCVAIKLYYQKLNPAANGQECYLDYTISNSFSGDSDYKDEALEVSFIPDPGSGKIISGFGLGCDGNNFDVLKIWQAPLYSIVTPATDVTESIEDEEIVSPSKKVAVSTPIPMPYMFTSKKKEKMQENIAKVGVFSIEYSMVTNAAIDADIQFGMNFILNCKDNMALTQLIFPATAVGNNIPMQWNIDNHGVENTPQSLIFPGAEKGTIKDTPREISRHNEGIKRTRFAVYRVDIEKATVQTVGVAFGYSINTDDDHPQSIFTGFERSIITNEQKAVLVERCNYIKFV